MIGPSTSRRVRRAAFDLKRRTVLADSDAIYRELVAGEQRSADEIAHRQQRAAIEAARFAMQQTVFYGEFYRDAGFEVSDLDDPDVFDQLPIVEKSHVRERFDDFRTPEANERTSVKSFTGGSTGQPLELLRDTRVSAQPLEWRLFRWWNVHPSDNIAIVYRQVKSARERRQHELQWWPSKRIQLDAYAVNEQSVREFVDRWNAVRPSLLTGYAGGVLEFARVCSRLGLEPATPIAVATTASPLTPEAREIVCEQLGAPVFDHYRSAEIPWMGGECQAQDGHHIFAETRVVEVVDDDDQPVRGSLGQVVATDMSNRVFPLIRYRLGDRTATIDTPCSCGVELPRVAGVVGKVGDGLRLPGGTWIATEAIYQLFSKRPDAVRQYRVHQRSDYSIEIGCMLGDSGDATRVVDEIVDGLRERTQRAVPIEWHAVASIEHDGGKIRYVTSDVG